jgi:hypothetical protein
MADREPRPWQVLGQALRCAVCGHDRFWTREAKLLGDAAAFLNVEWASASATCLVCERCTRIEWFAEATPRPG